MTEIARVLTFTTRGRERTTFDGTEEDARNYIRNNFPRLHVEPGSGDEPAPDAVLDVSGTRTYWNGSEWLEWTAPGAASGGPTEPDNRDSVIADQEAELARLRRQLNEREGLPTELPTGSRAAVNAEPEPESEPLTEPVAEPVTEPTEPVV